MATQSTPMNWRTASMAAIKANPMAYHRSRFLEARKAYPHQAQLAGSEYGWMRKLRARPTLSVLAQREAALRATPGAGANS